MSCEETIVISIITSLIAAIIYSYINSLNAIGVKRRVSLSIEYIRDCFWQLEIALNFEDYETVTQQADNIMQEILKMYNDIRKFTFLFKRKKLFFTFCHNVYQYMEKIKWECLGYNKDYEFNARCKKLKHYLKNEDENDLFSNWVSDSIDMLSYLATDRVRKAIKKYKTFNKTPLEKVIISYTYTDKESKTKDILKQNVMSRDEYFNFIKKL